MIGLLISLCIPTGHGAVFRMIIALSYSAFLSKVMSLRGVGFLKSILLPPENCNLRSALLVCFSINDSFVPMTTMNRISATTTNRISAG